MFRTLRNALLGIVLAACTAGPTGVPIGAYGVRLANSGTTPLQHVRVVTGEDVPEISSALLAPGQRTSVVRVRVLHASPIVRAVADGQEMVLHPIEGFIPGFNPAMPPGAYEIRLRYASTSRLGMEIVRLD